MLKIYNAINIHKLHKQILSKIDADLPLFIKKWNDTTKFLSVDTSGSTGNPKTITLSKKAVINSAKATNSFFGLNESNLYLMCLPIKYIAGKMMLIRSIESNAKMCFANSYSNPIKDLDQPIDFCAMTPFQLKNSITSSKEKFKWIKTLIIGGGIIDKKLEKELYTISTNCYQTFGMTETISHIALRKIDSKLSSNQYNCLDHVTINSNEINQLIINSKSLGIKNMISNDIIELIDNKTFKWIGRIDNVINSGGIKHYPELLEKKIEEHLQGTIFFIDKIEHTELGEQIILIIENSKNIKIKTDIFKNFSSYEIPKKIFELDEFIYTNNNKINRPKSRAKAINLNKWYKLDQ
ncbi:MAG: AMP-binding protein [Flavobacteriales bacterium]|nr:AMP-binding protein [Flavobacteriales bacterium]